MNALCCPNCKTPLTLKLNNSIHVCPDCNRVLQIKGNVIDFIPNQNFYWGEVDEKTMIRINEQAERDGWFKSINIHIEHKPTLIKYLLDPVRVAGAFHCYDENMNEACLDLGSGWGIIGYRLSKLYKTVYSVDGVYERLRFQAIRAKQDEIHNIINLRSTMLVLPLLDDSVDLAIINGLLEWIGLTRSDKDPHELQMIFLKEVFRVLRPGGKVIIGIENRFGAQNILGGIDHSGLKFTSLMPRWLASIMVRYVPRSKDSLIFTGAERSYRTLTYSYWGYRSLMVRAGFVDPDIYWAWPSYNFPRVTGTMDGVSISRYLRNVTDLMDAPYKRMFMYFANRLPHKVLSLLIKIFSPSFLIVSSKSFFNGSIQNTILGNESGEKQSFIRFSYDMRPDLKTTYFLLGPRNIRKIIQLTEMKGKERSKFNVVKREIVDGDPIKPYRRDHIYLAAQWLVDFQRSTQSGIWKIELLEKEMEDLYQKTSNVINNRQHSTMLLHYIDLYFSYIQNSPLPIVSEHGDYTTQNIFIKGSSINLIDWEYKKENGHPFMDVGGFSLELLSRIGGIKNFRPGDIISKFARFYKEKTDRTIFLSPVYYLLRIIARCIDANGLTPITYIYAQKWLSYLSDAIEFGEIA